MDPMRSRPGSGGTALGLRSRGWAPLAAWWDCGKWFAIGGLWLVAFALGLAGFAEFYDAEAAARGGDVRPHGLFDTLYVALQLFILESGSVYGPSVGWKLHAARVLAPAAAGATALQALAEVYRDHWREYRIRRGTGHVIVCGLGDKGWALVESFRRLGIPVAAVDQDPDQARSGACMEAGAAFIVGDATTPQILAKANAANAALLFAVCGEDGTNVAIAHRARFVATGAPGRGSTRPRRVPTPLRCFAHVHDPDLCALLAGECDQEDAFLLCPFSVAGAAAQAILNEHYVFGADWRAEPPHAHALVVGMGDVGRALVVEAARQWRGWYERREVPLALTLVDPDARATWDLLAARHPEEAARCAVRTLDHGTRCVEFERGGYLEASGTPPVTNVYVCLDDDAAGVQAALRLRALLGDRDVPVVVCVSREEGVAALLPRRKGADLPRIAAFGAVDHTCAAEVLLEDHVEQLAEAIHEDYRRKAEGGAGFPAWAELAPHLRASNYAQARHIPVKLRAAGCALRRGKPPRGRGARFSDAEVEQLAMMEHHRWVVERLLAGWLPGPEKDRANRISDCLVPWEALPESEREKDRDPVRDLPRFLEGAGFHIVRMKG